jgi:hypothetical protein
MKNIFCIPRLTFILLIFLTLSLACSMSQKSPIPVQPTSTRQSSATPQPSETLIRISSHTATLTNTPTSTTTHTATFTHTPTSTKTASPTPTPSATPTPTLSQAEQYLFQAEQAMQSVNTLKMKITLATKSGVIPVTFRGNGIAERPDKVYIKLSLLLQSYEVLSLSSDEVYVKLLGSDTWELTTPEQMDLPTSLLRNAFNLIDIRRTALSPVVMVDEDVNSVMCHHLTLGIDLPLYLAQRAPIASSQIDLVASRARGELWIGVDDHRIYKLNIVMEIVNRGETEAVPVNATIEFSGFNEPVEFPGISSYASCEVIAKDSWGYSLGLPQYH